MEAVNTFNRQTFSDYLSLTKPRITLLVLLTTLAAMYLAAHGLPDLWLVFFTLLGTGLASASAAVLNCYIDRDIDTRMTRTRNRPLPAGRLKPESALIFGILLQVLSFIVLVLSVNWLAALLALAANVSYVGVYTLWLKRTTPRCTEIGGIAGALPPVIGWAAVTNHIGVEALILFALMFLWQPPHFWALALFRTEEFRQANLPMLPVVRGPAVTKNYILLYAAAMLLISLLLYPLKIVGFGYLIGATVLGLGFVALAMLNMKASSGDRQAKQLFFYSMAYLSLLFIAMVLDCQCK
ncbi:protoheme IX farnesyltransferase [Candidatus Acetothermia bacterium]|nr:protoheme IX farnesyltransferase [Candidatus Acetothermia bacterium]MBI3459428.1 protoheme IX farnesyltransferase [Candidatus Acetothermia bacterium]